MPSEGCLDSLNGGCPVASMVIEIPAELKALGEAMVEALAAVNKARAGTGAGRALDYGAVETTIGEAAARIERGNRSRPTAAHFAGSNEGGGRPCSIASQAAVRKLSA